MVDKIAFTSKDLDKAFGLSNREQVYFVDRGYITPDIQADRPRLYSLPMAMLAGAIRYFEQHGYKLETASRIARFAIAPMGYVNREILPEVHIEMEILDGFVGSISFHTEGEKNTIYSFVIIAKVTDYKAAKHFQTKKWASVCHYSLRTLWEDWASSLGGYCSYVNKNPDFGIKIKTLDDGTAIAYMEGDDTFSSNK